LKTIEKLKEEQKKEKQPEEEKLNDHQEQSI